jgi:hypothetical protein
MNIATVTKKYQDGIWNKFYTVTLTDSTDIMSVPHDTEKQTLQRDSSVGCCR